MILFQERHTYTVHVTPCYSETTGSRVFPAESTEGTATLDRIGTYICYVLKEVRCDTCMY